MSNPVDSHSRFVKIGKFLLPAIALIMFLSLFLVSSKEAIVQGLILSDSELAELAVGQKITNPHYSGVTNKGDAFSISAEWALPDGPSPKQVELSKPSTSIDFSDGRSLKSYAANGLLDLKKDQAILSDHVTLSTSDGFSATSELLNLDFRTGNAISPGPVSAQSSLGTISAGSMEARQDLDKHPDGKFGVLLFQNGVKLVYIPKPKS